MNLRNLVSSTYFECLLNKLSQMTLITSAVLPSESRNLSLAYKNTWGCFARVYLKLCLNFIKYIGNFLNLFNII